MRLLFFITQYSNMADDTVSVMLVAASASWLVVPCLAAAVPSDVCDWAADWRVCTSDRLTARVSTAGPISQSVPTEEAGPGGCPSQQCFTGRMEIVVWGNRCCIEANILKDHEVGFMCNVERRLASEIQISGQDSEINDCRVPHDQVVSESILSIECHYRLSALNCSGTRPAAGRSRQG